MTYYVGVDGGGTKAHCIIGNEKGEVLGEGFGGRCNYQSCGIEVAMVSLNQAIEEALEQAGIEKEDLSYGVFGLSGADEPMDFEILEPVCQDLVPNGLIKVLNDTWIGLRTGDTFGVVSICGTGAGFAGKDREGNQCILRNINFLLGNRGGGGEILEKAIHYAFRSEEGTYKKSRLEAMVLEVFACEQMEEITHLIRNNDIPGAIAYEIPKLTMMLSDQGDIVAREIIVKQGTQLGMYASAVGKKLGLEAEEVPMVLVGSVFKSGNAVLIDAFMAEVKKSLPKAFYVIPEKAPVYGAFWLALELG